MSREQALTFLKQTRYGKLFDLDKMGTDTLIEIAVVERTYGPALTEANPMSERDVCGWVFNRVRQGVE